MDKTYLLTLFSLLILFSCNEKENWELEPIQIGSVDTTSTVILSTKERIALRFMRSKTSKISEFEAYDKAISFISEVHNSTNKSLAFRSLSSCIPLTTKKSYTTLKSSELIDTLAYVINFDDSLGYVIVPADIRVEDEVLAFSEIGNIDLNEENDGFELFMSYANDYMRNQIEQFDNEYDSLKNVLADKIDTIGIVGANKKQELNPDNDILPPLPWHTIKMVSPLTAVEWGQDDPYNKYTPLENGQQTLAGCVAVATAQIMAKWKYPNTIDGQNINWSKIVQYTWNKDRKKYFGTNWNYSIKSDKKTDAANEIAILMRLIGDNIGMDYGIDASKANTSVAVNWLRRIGYSAENVCAYNIDKVKNSIDNGCIVLAQGIRTGNVGHAWNIDGYLVQMEQYDEAIIDDETGRIIGQKYY